MRLSIPFALCLFSLPAAAQTPWAQGTELPDPPPTQLEDPSPTFWQRTARIALELVGASVGAGVSVGVGAGFGCALNAGECRSETTFIAAVPLALFGVPAGVTLAGGLMDARGSYGWSVLGELGGSLIALPVALLLQRRPAIAAFAMIVLPITGAIVGFEVSADNAPARRHRAARLRWSPTLSAGPEGAMLGASGVF